MNKSDLKKTIKRQSFKSCLFTVMCFYVLTCTCLAQDIIIIKDSRRNPNETVHYQSESLANFSPFYFENIVGDMYRNAPELYSQFRSGERNFLTGAILSFSGVLISGIGGFAYVANYDSSNKKLSNFGKATLVTGSICFISGLPLIVIGEYKKSRAFTDYIRHYSSHSASPYFQLNVYPNRVGLAYVF